MNALLQPNDPMRAHSPCDAQPAHGEAQGSRLRLLPGTGLPFGAHLCPEGVHFSIWSEYATRIELCIFDTDGLRELRRFDLYGPDHDVFSGLLVGAGEGLVYGYRAHGPYQPELGHRFNPSKLLLDPYARELVGRFHWLDEHFGYCRGDPSGARTHDAHDNALPALKARVRKPSPLPVQRPVMRRTEELVLYEVHVKGFTMRMPGIPDALRGSYAGLAHPVALDYLKQLGVTTLSLLPVHYSLSEAHLLRSGLSNYWGYNTLGFFQPDPRLSRRRHDFDGAIDEFRDMVAAVHQAGMEVVLDVVYNHTAEGDALGPTLSFRGLDQRSWYRLLADDPSRMENYSGCGNTLNLAHPRVIQFVLDSLRYWVSEFGVDGFRFDLATILARGAHGFDPNAPFLVALRQDPLLSRVRWIAEPWDCGPDGYQVGRFPGAFLDWNDRFRDAMRGYWLPSAEASAPRIGRGEFARRFCASSDLFQHGRRRPTASLNFIAAHDGFTLADVVSYARKHNLANGEQNRDGREHELCHNFGADGQAQGADLESRDRVRHAMLATVLLAQGTPMLLAGDECGHSQGGNNNAYCQDNATSWLDWAKRDPRTLTLVRRLIELRRQQPLLRHPEWFHAELTEHTRARLVWRTPHGAPMQVHDWHAQGEACLCAEYLAPQAQGPSLRLLFNPESQPVRFSLPERGWRLILDSSAPELDPLSGSALSDVFVIVPAHSVLALLPPVESELSA